MEINEAEFQNYLIGYRHGKEDSKINKHANHKYSSLNWTKLIKKCSYNYLDELA